MITLCFHLILIRIRLIRISIINNYNKTSTLLYKELLFKYYNIFKYQLIQ